MQIQEISQELICDRTLYSHKDQGCWLSHRKGVFTCEECPFVDCYSCLDKVYITAIENYDKIKELYKATDNKENINGRFSAKFRTYWLKRRPNVIEVYKEYGLG